MDPSKIRPVQRAVEVADLQRQGWRRVSNVITVSLEDGTPVTVVFMAPPEPSLVGRLRHSHAALGATMGTGRTDRLILDNICQAADELERLGEVDAKAREYRKWFNQSGPCGEELFAARQALFDAVSCGS